MKTWIWIVIIVLAIAASYYAGKQSNKKGCGCDDSKDDKKIPETPKNQVDQKNI